MSGECPMPRRRLRPGLRAPTCLGHGATVGSVGGAEHPSPSVGGCPESEIWLQASDFAEDSGVEALIEKAAVITEYFGGERMTSVIAKGIARIRKSSTQVDYVGIVRIRFSAGAGPNVRPVLR